MNVPLKHSDRFPVSITAPFWIVFGGDDVDEGGGRLFTTKAKAEHYLSGFYGLPFQVWEGDPDTGRLHDVTWDFLTDDPAEPFSGDYAHADHFGQLMRGA